MRGLVARRTPDRDLPAATAAADLSPRAPEQHTVAHHLRSVRARPTARTTTRPPMQSSTIAEATTRPEGAWAGPCPLRDRAQLRRADGARRPGVRELEDQRRGCAVGSRSEADKHKSTVSTRPPRPTPSSPPRSPRADRLDRRVSGSRPRCSPAICPQGRPAPAVRSRRTPLTPNSDRGDAHALARDCERLREHLRAFAFGRAAAQRGTAGPDEGAVSGASLNCLLTCELDEERMRAAAPARWAGSSGCTLAQWPMPRPFARTSTTS